LKIYTKTGDKGETSLFGGRRVFKDDARIDAYGTVDELNAVIGVAKSFNENARIESILRDIQVKLFVLGADLATPAEVKSSAVQRISSADCRLFEKTIDELETELDPLKTFILPGGSTVAALLHHARTVCRRAERRVVTLRRQGDVSEETLVFLNRLSDLLFVLARFANKESGMEDVPWIPRAESDTKV